MSEIGLQIDIGSKNLELFEQNSVKRLSGWDPNEVAWVGVAWGGRPLEKCQRVPLFYLLCG
jgi:hypothetical protein